MSFGATKRWSYPKNPSRKVYTSHPTIVLITSSIKGNKVFYLLPHWGSLNPDRFISSHFFWEQLLFKIAKSLLQLVW